MTLYSSQYINFLDRKDKLFKTNLSFDVHLTAIKLLEIVAISNSRDTPLKVSDAMKLNHIASPATIHRRIKDLLEADLIKLEKRGDNQRTKYLVLTKKADELFTKLGSLLEKTI